MGSIVLLPAFFVRIPEPQRQAELQETETWVMICLIPEVPGVQEPVGVALVQTAGLFLMVQMGDLAVMATLLYSGISHEHDNYQKSLS